MIMEYPICFLPKEDPLEMLPAAFSPWEETAKNLPKFLVASQFQKKLEKLPSFPTDQLHTEAEYERAMQILSYFGHAYVWGQKNVPDAIPAVLAKPWYEVAKHLGRPPVLSYASYALANWKRIDNSGPIDLGNIALIQNFLGGIDEEWFILVHVAIESKAKPALVACVEAISAVQKENRKSLMQSLEKIKNSLESICNTLDRMPEHCDPYIYYHRVRPYLHGWKNHPLFPNGLKYEGVQEYHEKPQQFRGETGAQSSIIPTLDGLLGIKHAKGELYHYLQEMRDYMPPKHREFISYVEDTSKVRQFVQTKKEFHEIYNACVCLINRFRQTHLGFAETYIQKQYEDNVKNPTAVGTGGTPFMNYLKKHQDETESFLL
jgi:indoleamine 2,3-dioxygenase